MCTKERETRVRIRDLWRLVFAGLLTVASGSALLAQATSNSNQIKGEVRFTNANPDILEILNAPPGADKGFSRGKLTANSLDVTPTLNNATGIPASSRTLASYEVTVESSADGIAYRVGVIMRLDHGTDFYHFGAQDSPLVFPEPTADVELDFADCAGIVDVHFVDEDGLPATVKRASFSAHRQPGNSRWAWSWTLPYETSSETLAVPGDGSEYRIDAYYYTSDRTGIGSDPYVDLIRIDAQRYLCREYVTVQCDEIQVIECVIPNDNDPTGPLDPDDLGEIVGEVDMLCEDEHRISPTHTRMRAYSGPYDNQRYDFLDATPSSGDFRLQNMLRSDFTSRPEPYLVYAEMSFRQGHAYEYFRSPFLGHRSNPKLFVEGGEVHDLGDTFVMNPGYLAMDIRLAGPPPGAQRACLEGIYRDADVDSDGDGIPNSTGLGRSRLVAIGLDTRADGAAFTASAGYAKVGFDGSFNPSTESFEGSSELVLAGLDQEPSMWYAPWLVLWTFGTPERYMYSNADVANHTFPAFEIVPKETLAANHHYCFSEVEVTFKSVAGTFYAPRLSGSGSFVGTDFEGTAADYTVYLEAKGTPRTLATADEEGSVVLCTPAATYTMTPFVTSVDPGGGTSNTELPPVTFSCGCRQVCVLTPEIQIHLDPLAQCTADATLSFSGSVNSDVDVDRIFYTVGGTSVDVCSGNCGVDPSFAATLTLSSCDNELAVTAVDVLGNEASVTSTVTLDAQPPVLSGCEPITVEVEPDDTEAQVSFDVTASDECSGAVSVECDPPSGSVFPVGETQVTCVTSDACDGSSECTFPVTVTSCQPVEPDVRTQGFWKRQCEGPHPSGEHDNLPHYVECVAEADTFADLDDVDALCDALVPQPRNDKCEQAEAQLMALRLNVCSDRVRLCNCLEDPDLGATTVGEAAAFIDALLSSPDRTRGDCVLAQGIADRVNNDATLVECTP